MFVLDELWRKLFGEIVLSNKKIFCRTFGKYKSLSVNPRCIESKLAEIVQPPLKIITHLPPHWERGNAILRQRCNLARLSVTLPSLGFAQVT